MIIDVSVLAQLCNESFRRETATMPVRIVEDCIGIATASAALESVCRGMDVTMIRTEASETDERLRNHAKSLGFKRVIKDCADKR